MAPPRICSVSVCGKTHYSLGFCRAHYNRLKKHGDPLGGGAERPRGKPSEFFEYALRFEGDECLTWPYARLANGYSVMSRGGRVRLVHREICEEINGPPPTPKHEAAHSCGNGALACINKKHLRWATSKENGEDMVEHGRSTRGERHGYSRLTRGDVLKIRALAKKMSQREIADHFGVSRSAVGHVLRGNSWGWLTE